MIHRNDLIKSFIINKKFNNYLELYYLNNKDFKVKTKEINSNIDYDLTSEQFFEKINNNEILFKNYKWDIIFIDEYLPTFQIEKNIIKYLDYLSDNGFLILNNCKLIINNIKSFDVNIWKILYKFNCTRKDLDIYCVDIDNGLGVIKKNKNERELPSFNNIYFDYNIFYNDIKNHLNLISLTEFENLFFNSQKNNIYDLKIKTDKIVNTDNIVYFNFNFIDGAYLEINSSLNLDNKYKIIFENLDDNTIIYETIISINMWSKCLKKYFINWGIKIIDLNTNKLIFEHNFNAENKNVYIHIDSNAIGDTLSWFPYIEEFRVKHKCNMIASTFYNDWFETKYPNIKFINPGSSVNDLYASYPIGWFYDKENNIDYDKTPIDFRKYPLQRTSSQILGIDYKEIKPLLSFDRSTSYSYGKKFVCISPHASSHAKYWNYPNGWQTIIDYLKNKDYEVVYISKESLDDNWHNSKLGGKLNNIIDKSGDYPLQDRVNDLISCEFFIGVGSGLSWLSWALNVKTILISGFSEPYTEFQDCERIFTPEPNINCNSCFNKYRLDPSDWDWCPEHKKDNKIFECTKKITPDIVINSINNII